MKIKQGISVLIAAQDVEETLALSIRSFLEFGDEIIIVDNGSADNSKEIAQEYVLKYPKKIKFYDEPMLPDLYHNRQFALEKSSFRWIVRADADFIAYDHILELRNFLLKNQLKFPLLSYATELSNVTADFWHTGIPLDQSNSLKNELRKYIPPPITCYRPRIYYRFPGFKFQRRGRWEGVRFESYLRTIKWGKPLWMHCNLKSERSYFFRAERTNWRETGNFKKYPTLSSYVKACMKKKYVTNNIDEAAHIYMEKCVYPFLERYDPIKYFSYPRLVCQQMKQNPIYKINRESGRLIRKYYGPAR